MRNFSPLQSLTFIASGAVAAFRGVGFDGAQATVQGQKVRGVSPRAVADGEAGDAIVSGTAVMEAGAAFAKGDSLIVDSSGRAIKFTGALKVATGATEVTSSAANGAILTGSDLPEYVFADAEEAASGAGVFVEVLLRR